MNPITSLIKRYPLIAFFSLAYGLSWAVYPLLAVSPMLGIIALFGPAIAAIVVSVLTGGRAAIAALFQRLGRWRIPIHWYAIAAGLPLLLGLAAALLNVVLGAPLPNQLAPVMLINIILILLVVGEELGWRGYALPKLLESHSALSASLILGVLWAGWHLPGFFIPGLPQYGEPFLGYLLWFIALSVLFTWLYQHTQGSVLLATVFHGMHNLSGVFLYGVEPARQRWLLAAVSVAAALLIILMNRWRLRRSLPLQDQAATA